MPHSKDVELLEGDASGRGIPTKRRLGSASGCCRHVRPFWKRETIDEGLTLVKHIRGRMPKSLCISQNLLPLTILGTPIAQGVGKAVPTNRILLVEPETILRLVLCRAAEVLADVDAEAGIAAARRRLVSKPYDWLITNIRLEAYNGLHLAYLAKVTQQPTKILIYSEEADLLLAREAQRLGAFYESRETIQRSLAGYLSSALPASDRRDVGRPDRRAMFRGGRRSSDFERLADPAAVRQTDLPRASAVRMFRER